MSTSDFYTQAPMGTRANDPSVVSHKESGYLPPVVEQRAAERIRGGCMICPGGGFVMLDCSGRSENFQDDKLEESQRPQPMQLMRSSQPQASSHSRPPSPASHLRPPSPSPDQRPPSRESRWTPSHLSGRTAVEWLSTMQYVRSLLQRFRMPHQPRGENEASEQRPDHFRHLPFVQIRDFVKGQLDKNQLEIVW